MDYRILLLLILPLTIICVPAFAQSSDISVATDSESYVSGDTIIVSGKVGIFIPDTPIIIQIFYGNNQVGVAQEPVADDGGFTAAFQAFGPLWVKDGVYTVRASYGIDNISEINFNFFADIDISKIELKKQDVTLADGGTFDIGYLSLILI